MKKIFFVFVFCLFLVLSCFAESEGYIKSLFSKVPYKSAVYTQKTTGYLSGSEKPVVGIARVWYKNGKIRTEEQDEKGKTVSLGIVRDGYAYRLLNIESKEGLKAEIDPKNSAFAMLVDNDAGKNAVKNGEETVNGVKCGIYEYERVTKVLFMETKSMITEYRNSDGFVMKTITMVQGNDRPSIVEVTKLEKNPMISDSKFELPKDVTYTDMMESFGLKGKASTGKTDGVKEPKASVKEDNVKTVVETEEESPPNSNEDIVGKVAGDAAGAVLKGLFGQ